MKKVYNSLANTTEGGTLHPPSDVHVRTFLSPFHTWIKLCYTKALEWSNLVPGPEAKSSSSEITNRTPFILSVNYKLALTKSIANDWTTKAFAICLYADWTLCCYSCWPLNTPDWVQGGVRHSVLQGIWWGRSLDSWMFLGIDFMISILVSPLI